MQRRSPAAPKAMRGETRVLLRSIVAMLEARSTHSARQRALPAALTLLALGVLAPSPAYAHFILEEPPAVMSQDALGTPQKLGPCGDEATTPPATPTGIVTTFQEGQTITVTVDGTVPHPGHWRVSLGLTGPGDLPAEPVVTAAATPCGSAAIEDPPVFPVLGDNLLPSTAGFTGDMSMQITLPAGVTCTNCTLQVIQFMSDHPLNNPGGCFYHHCATISIVSSDGGIAGTSSSSASSSGAEPSSSSASSAGAGPSSSAAGPSSSATGSTGAGTSAAAGTGGGAGATGPSASSGCGCTVPASTSPAFLGVASLFAVAALMRRQRRR